MLGYDDINPAAFDAWLTTDSEADTMDELHEQFVLTEDYDNSYATYAADFRYSADYELAFEQWVRDQLDP